MKKMFAVICLFLGFASMIGCEDKNQVDGGNNMTEFDVNSLDDKEYLVKVYGFTEEELENIDMHLFAKVGRFREEERSSEDLHAILEKYRDKMTNENYPEEMLILTARGNNRIKQGTRVVKIGYYLNSGTYVQEAVFDVAEKKYYVNDNAGREFLDDLSDITDRYEVYKWESNTEGKELKTTGNYAWKLVFEDADGTNYVYTGNSPDGSHLPDTYKELSKELIDICKE